MLQFKGIKNNFVTIINQLTPSNRVILEELMASLKTARNCLPSVKHDSHYSVLKVHNLTKVSEATPHTLEYPTRREKQTWKY